MRDNNSFHVCAVIIVCVHARDKIIMYYGGCTNYYHAVCVSCTCALVIFMQAALAIYVPH